MRSRILITLTAIVLLLPLALRAQILEPVKWAYASVKTGETEYELHLKATIDPGWHIYAQQAGDGPIPTTVTFEDNPAVTLTGAVAEHGHKITKFDKVFDSELRYYEDTVDFVQKVKITGPATLIGTLEYMVCDDRQCLPPKDIPIRFVLTAEGGSPEAAGASAIPATKDTVTGDRPMVSTAPKGVVAEDNASGKSLGWIFWACFGGGFLALITPCVFSMIPITVGFFTKHSKTRAAGIRNAIWYSLSIMIIYTFLGFLITIIFGPSALNQLASNIWANLAFFLIFLVFGISFLGAFEISLPGSWSTKTDTQAGLGNFGGLFFMALTLSIVSFSCTGPIIGNLLVLAAQGGKVGPLIGMFGFSLALAIPFALFAIFPSWLNKIGKAGGWLNAVKVVLGLLEIALALKFLSNVDMAYHWGILSKELFLAIWIVLFALIGLYLLGKIRFSHDSPAQPLSVTRLFFAIAALSFMVYLVPGLFGADLKGLVGGFLPNYSSITHPQSSAGNETAAAYNGVRAKKYVDIFVKATPHGYTAFYDYDEAMAAAKKLNKPIMIDFTGWSCVNCRKMESEVWTDPGVRNLINQEFVLLQLYVDDKTTLPEAEQYTSTFDGSKIKRLGNKNADFEIVKFNRNSQPYYVLLDQAGEMLNPKGYSAQDGYDPQNFISFLRQAKAEYTKRHP